MNSHTQKLAAAGALAAGAYLVWKVTQARDMQVPVTWALKQITQGHPFYSSAELGMAWHNYLDVEQKKLTPAPGSYAVGTNHAAATPFATTAPIVFSQRLRSVI